MENYSANLVESIRQRCSGKGALIPFIQSDSLVQNDIVSLFLRLVSKQKSLNSDIDLCNSMLEDLFGPEFDEIRGYDLPYQILGAKRIKKIMDHKFETPIIVYRRKSYRLIDKVTTWRGFPYLFSLLAAIIAIVDAYFFLGVHSATFRNICIFYCCALCCSYVFNNTSPGAKSTFWSNALIGIAINGWLLFVILSCYYKDTPMPRLLFVWQASSILIHLVFALVSSFFERRLNIIAGKGWTVSLHSI